MVKQRKTVGYIPCLFSKMWSLSGNYVKVCVTENENQRGNGLEVPCILTIKVSEHMYVKVKTVIKGMCGRLV